MLCDQRRKYVGRRCHAFHEKRATSIEHFKNVAASKLLCGTPIYIELLQIYNTSKPAERSNHLRLLIDLVARNSGADFDDQRQHDAAEFLSVIVDSDASLRSAFEFHFEEWFVCQTCEHTSDRVRAEPRRYFIQEIGGTDASQDWIQFQSGLSRIAEVEKKCYNPVISCGNMVRQKK